MKVGIFINTTKSEANTAANEFGRILNDNSIESKVVNLKEDCKGIDVIAVFGGDGTILRVIDYAIEYDIPVLSVNIGTVGFLTSVESNELEKAVELIKDFSNIEKRSVIKITDGSKKYYALNEALVQRDMKGNSISGVAKLSLEINGEFVDNFFADGIILSTPTGSTAYSLSAGGAILSPELNAFIATPVCAHSLHNKPIVYPDSYTATVKVLKDSNKCCLIVDGKYVKPLACGDSIEVSKSKKMVKFFSANKNFFEKLLLKLNKWSETR